MYATFDILEDKIIRTWKAAQGLNLSKEWKRNIKVSLKFRTCPPTLRAAMFEL